MIYEQVKRELEQADPDRFIKKAKALVMEQRADNAVIYLVWFSKTLQNWKALLSTDVSDGLYYEVTYNGDEGVAYVDTYERRDNIAILDDRLVEEEPLQDVLPFTPYTI